ncbi:hypothetical protein AWRI1631_152450, partial [Saccharomyces cerevisiae AWRI1631]
GPPSSSSPEAFILSKSMMFCRIWLCALVKKEPFLIYFTYSDSLAKWSHVFKRREL